MKIAKNLARLITAVTLTCFLVSCTGYNRVGLPKDRTLPVEEKGVKLYCGTNVYYLADVGVTDEGITAKAFEGRFAPHLGKGQELHIYTLPGFETPAPLPAKVSVPFTAIEKVEIYNPSNAKTLCYNLAWIVPVTIIIILLASKSSCPFIYTSDGSSYDFAGEIYSGATLPPTERDDYLPLPNFKAVDGEYRLELANEVREIQNTNLTELLVIDHAADAEVLVDKYGVPHTLTDVHSPAAAVTAAGADVTALVAAADDTPYVSTPSAKADAAFDGVVLTFTRPPGATAGKMVIRAKNSFWLDYSYGGFLNLFGDAYYEWYESQKNASAEELRKWSLDQGIPLAVYVERDGDWEFVDYYDVAGPMAMKRDVLAFDLPAGGGDDVKVKLAFGPLFWEIDYVGMDFSADGPVEVHAIPPASAFDQAGRDVTGLLRADDGLYYVQPEVGDYALLTFAAPPPAEGRARATILHSKGHYEILRDPPGKPDLKLLYSFQRPGRFIEFSQELFLESYRTMVRRED